MRKIKILKLCLKNIKINAVHNLRGISFALGRERTRKELLPYLISCIEEEEDETLIELAKICSNFLDYIGGKQYSKELFNIIENFLLLVIIIDTKENSLMIKKKDLEYIYGKMELSIEVNLKMILFVE